MKSSIPGFDVQLTQIDDNELNVSVQDTFDTYHTYEIDWTPDQITWSVNNKPQRTKKRSDTWNTTTNSYHFPQTPARIQLSIWPAGQASNGQGTVDWAGGLVSWQAPDPKNAGYYYAMVNSVNVTCYDPPTGANVTGKTSYVYTNTAGTNASVSETDDKTVLKSLLGSGTDMSKDYPSQASGSSAPTSTNIATIPGLSGAGPGTDGQRGDGGTGSSGSNPNPGSGTGSSSANAPGSSSTGIGGFSQGNSGSKSGASSTQETVLQGSVFAILVAIVGMLSM